MEKYLYNPKNNAFYPYALQDEYMAAGSWPTSGVDVDESVFAEFSGEHPAGKLRIAGEDGYPAWGDIPPQTHEEQVAIADAEKQSLIDRANEYINSKQYPGKAAMGRLKDTENERYNLWLDYLDALEVVDTSSAPNIEWPTSPVD